MVSRLELAEEVRRRLEGTAMAMRPDMLNQRSTANVRGRRGIACALVASMLLSPGCAAFRPLRGVPASHVPPELLAESREGRRTINLSLLVRSPVDQHRVEGGDILAVYIPGLLGVRNLIGPALGRETVGEAPPITAPANIIDPPTMGYPVTVRDDHTLVLPQLPPINVYGMTLREVECAIADACRVAQLMQMQNTQILVSLWRPREYRVMVVRQEATESTTIGGGQGTVDPGVSKRGSGQVVRLRAYENDVLHALTNSAGGNNGLPGLDAENAIYVIRRNKCRGASPAESVMPPMMQPVPPAPQVVSPGPVMHTPANTPPVASPMQQPQSVISPSAPVAAAPTQAPSHSSTPPYSSTQQDEPFASDPPTHPAIQPYTPPERIQYGTPQNGLPILPQSHQIIRGQNPSRAARLQAILGATGGHSTSQAGHSTGSSYAPIDVRTAEFGRRDAQSTAVQTVTHQSAQPYGGPSVDPYAATPIPSAEPMWPGQYQGVSPPAFEPAYPSAPPSWNMAPSAGGFSGAPACRTPIAGLFPQQFSYEDLTIDSPSVIRIPIRLGPGETPNICEEDITLYDGDIVFIESRDSEVFYTGGLLGGGEYQLPRDRDLHVLEAVSIAQSRVGQGGSGAMSSPGGVSSLNGDVTISPSRVIVRRRLEDGRIVPIEVDLYRARLRPEEDILIQPRDLIMLQYKCGEATLAFIERHLLAGALFGVAAAQLSTGSQ
jgi:hypothetical protein